MARFGIAVVLGLLLLAVDSACGAPPKPQKVVIGNLPVGSGYVYTYFFRASLNRAQALAACTAFTKGVCKNKPAFTCNAGALLSRDSINIGNLVPIQDYLKTLSPILGTATVWTQLQYTPAGITPAGALAKYREYGYYSLSGYFYETYKLPKGTPPLCMPLTQWGEFPATSCAIKLPYACEVSGRLCLKADKTDCP